MEHPEIDLTDQFDSETLFVREMAEEAMEVLLLYGHRVSSVEDNCDITRYVTPRTNIDGSILDGHETALRLKRVSAVSISENSRANAGHHLSQNQNVSIHPEEKQTLVVMNLELGKIACGELADLDAYEVTDQDFTWQSYALIVSDAATGEADILNGQTGEVLSSEDVLSVLSALQFMHRALRFIKYEETVVEGEDPLQPEISPHSEEPPDELKNPFSDTLDTEDVLIQNYAVHQCEHECTASHQQAMLN